MSFFQVKITNNVVWNIRFYWLWLLLPICIVLQEPPRQLRVAFVSRELMETALVKYYVCLYRLA